MLASSMVVGAYERDTRRRVRWDHTDEHPLRDARHYEEPDAHEPPTDDDLGLANTVLTNGARFYVDHAHPEYSSPECSDARSAVVWDKAGELVLETAAAEATRALPHAGRVLVHKNNTDGKGAAYGTHENYLLPRSIPFGTIIRELLPFFASRTFYVGAGRLGTELDAGDLDPDTPYQLTQRADFFEVEVGLETTLKRPIINTRDEPHADPERFRRLHVINGDANLCEVATYLKVGATLLVLDVLEDGAFSFDGSPGVPRLADPVRAFHASSHDLTGRRGLELDDGRTMSSIDLQWFYLDAVRKHAASVRELDDQQRHVVDRWAGVLETMERDPMALAGTVDWATKLDLLRSYRDRHELDWGDAKLAMVDLQYHDVRRDKGLFHRLVARGQVERLTTDDEVRRAVSTMPPADTRAWFRGRCLDRFREDVVAAGWDALIFDTGRDAYQRVPMLDPSRGTRALVGDLLEEATSAADLLEKLGA